MIPELRYYNGKVKAYDLKRGSPLITSKHRELKPSSFQVYSSSEFTTSYKRSSKSEESLDLWFVALQSSIQLNKSYPLVFVLISLSLKLTENQLS